MQILKHWEVISTLYLGHPFYWRPGIKTSSTATRVLWVAIIEGILPVSKSEPRFYVRAQKVISFFCPLLFPSSSSFSPFFPLFFESKWCWAGALRLGDRDRTCVAVGQREEWGEGKHREMSRTDVTEGITWKKDGEKRGEGDIDGSERVAASEEDGARVIYMSESCVCVRVRICVAVCDTLPISSHPACPILLSPLLSHPLSPLPLFFLPFPPSLSPTVYADSNLTGPGLTDLKPAG